MAVVLVPSHSHSLDMVDGQFAPIHFHEVISGLLTLPVFRLSGLAKRTAKAFADLVNDSSPGQAWLVEDEVYHALCVAARTVKVQPSHAPAFLFLMDALWSAKWIDPSPVVDAKTHPSDEEDIDLSQEAPSDDVLTDEARAMMAQPASPAEPERESNKPLAGSIAARSRK